MTMTSLLGNIRIAAGVLSLLTQSLVLLLIGWGLSRAAHRMAAPLKSGILLALMVVLVLLPFGILVLSSSRVSLYQLPVSPAGIDLTRGTFSSGRALAEQGIAVAQPAAQGQDLALGKKAGSSKLDRLFDFTSLDLRVMALNIFGLIWLLGVIISVGRLLYGMIFLSGFRSSLTGIPEEELSGAMEAVRSAFPGARLPSVHVSPAVDSPVALGIRRPMIVLPTSLARNLSSEELTNILIHETAHIRHLDQVSGLLQRLMTSLYWWNPLAYELSASFSVTREEVSDNYAIQRSGARSYANCLVDLARKTSLITRLPAAVGIATRHISLEHRVRNIVSKERIMETKIKRPFVFLLSLASILLAGLVVRYSWTLTVEKRVPVASTAEVRTFTLPRGIEPMFLAAEKDRIYLCEYENFPQKPESHISIYSESDFSLLAKIGPGGIGADKFRVFGPGRFYVANGQIWAPDIRKIIVFARDGTFQKEIAIPRDVFLSVYPLVPIGDKFASLADDWSDVGKGTHRVFGRLYDADFRMVREFYGEIPLQFPPPPPPPPPPGQKAEAAGDDTAIVKTEYQAIPECIDFAVAEDKIFVADTRKGFHIAVFDSSGMPLYEINQNYAALPVPPEYNTALRKKLDETQGWLNKVADIKFRDSFPAFYSFKIADRKIYVSTYAERDGLNELIIMDLKGDILKRSFSFPLGPTYDSMYNNFNVAKDRYAIWADRLFYLAKSAKDGTYEVRIEELK